MGWSLLLWWTLATTVGGLSHSLCPTLYHHHPPITGTAEETATSHYSRRIPPGRLTPGGILTFLASPQ
jgi:hypothetical protein